MHQCLFSFFCQTHQWTLGCLLILGLHSATAQPATALLTDNYRVSLPDAQQPMISLRETLQQVAEQHQVTINYQDQLIEPHQLTSGQVQQLLQTESSDLIRTVNQVLRPMNLMLKHYDQAYYMIVPRAKATSLNRVERQLLSSGTVSVPIARTSILSKTSVPTESETIAPITGTVTDETGTGLPGATVVLKGNASTGTITDIEGNYSINVPDDQSNPILVFSFVGYTTQEVPVNDQSVIDVQLTDDVTSLEEVVVVGYGTQKKDDLTGSITAISTKDFNEGFVPTAEQLISGKVAGVQITSNGGAPGAGSRIRIRGGASLNASNDPLIVVDGVPIATSEVSGAANPLSFISPNDIASFNILKDASATAIYGSRASNGVIIITTKRGEEDQSLTVDLSSQQSLATVIRTVDVLSADAYRNVVNERGTEAQQALLGNASTDWQDQIYRPAFTTDNNVSVSGAVGWLPFRASAGYLNQQGVVKTSQFERISGSLNLNPSFLDGQLQVNLNLRGVVTNSRFAADNATVAAIAMDPTQPIFDNNEAFGGYYQWVDENGNFNPNATVNPLALLNQRSDEGTVRRSIGNLQFDYQLPFISGLKANLNLGYDVSETEGEEFEPLNYAPVVVQGGKVRPYGQNKSNYLLDAYLAYSKYLSELKGQLDITAGYSYQDFSIDEPRFPTLNLAGDTISQENPVFPQNRLISVFGRLNYVFNDRYLLTATLRRDGSSRFAEDNRWGLFPSVALAWRINEEDFLVNSDVVSQLKLRVGYGVTGQQDVTGDFPYLARYTLSDAGAQYSFGNTFYTLYRPEAYDPNIKWEETATYNAGVDYGFLNGRINGTLDVYRKETSDLLSIVPVAAGTNFTNQLLTNVGSIRTQGMELVLNYIAIDRDDFGLEFGVNGTLNDIKITNLSRVEDANEIGVLVGGISGGIGTTVQVHTVGFAPFSFYVYEQRYDDNGRPLENEFVDRNGDGAVTEADRYRYQSPNPDFYYGFNVTARYRNWTFGLVTRGSVGNYVYNNVDSQYGNYASITAPGFLTNITTDVFNTGFANRPDELLLSDYYVQNASFFRAETINAAYNFGNFLNDRIRNLRVSASVQNAFVISGYEGLDPEIPEGIDNNFYPRPRTYALGINVSF